MDLKMDLNQYTDPNQCGANNTQGVDFTVCAQKITKIQLSHLVDKLVLVFGDTPQEDESGTKERVVKLQLEKTFEELVIVFNGAFDNNKESARAFVKDLLAKAITELPD